MAKTDSHNLLDPATISRAEALGLQARMIVEGYMSGEHKSPFKGFSVEFAQHREYVAGDDTRHLDWKVLGRTGRYYIKQYEQNTNYIAHLLLDGSESMNYGSGEVTKLDYGRSLVACLAYLILLQRDAMSLGVFDTEIRERVARTDSMGIIHELLLKLAAFKATGETRLGLVLNDVAMQAKRRGIVVVISDFFDDEEKMVEGIQHLRFKGNEVVVFHVMDPYELEFPFKGLVEFEGLEKIPMIKTSPAEIRKSYLEAVDSFCKRIRKLCEDTNSHYVLVNTRQPLQEVVMGYLAQRLGSKG